MRRAGFRQNRKGGFGCGIPETEGTRSSGRTASDGREGIREAMVEVYGKIPEYSGCGRPPSKKRSQPEWKYLQIVKKRDDKGRFLGTRF